MRILIRLYKQKHVIKVKKELFKGITNINFEDI